MAYDALGRRTSMTDGTGTNTYVWDSLGRLTRHTNGAGAQVSYGYDLAGRMSAITYPTMAGSGTRTVTREYDGAGRMSAVQDWGARRFGFTYDPSSNLVRQDYPNMASATWTYDAVERPLSVSHTSGGTTVLNLAYARGSSGLVTAENGAAFAYDPNDRLTSAATPPPTTYGYDAGDNLRRMATSTATTDLAYDAAHQLNSATVTGGPLPQTASFSYDANGNRTGRTGGAGTTVYAYDQANRLIAAGGATYAYDGDGLRTAKVAAATQGFTWDVAEGLPLILQDGTTSYVTGPKGLPLAQISPVGSIAYYHADQLGSTRALTDAAGAVVARYSFDAYGNLSSSTGTAVNPFRFAGQYTDTETGFQYLRARYYDPATGQFLTKDPIEGGSANDYDYVSGDPVNNLDLDGNLCIGHHCVHAPKIVKKAVAAGAGFVAKTGATALSGTKWVGSRAVAYGGAMRSLPYETARLPGWAASGISGAAGEFVGDVISGGHSFGQMAWRAGASGLIAGGTALAIGGVCATGLGCLALAAGATAAAHYGVGHTFGRSIGLGSDF